MAKGGDTDSKAVASKIGKPVSTVQRRVRQLFEKGVLRWAPSLDYSVLGLKTGMLHVYIKDGDFQKLANELVRLDGVVSVSVHLGNSDIVLEFVFGESRDVMELIAIVKHMQGVERVLWSERVYAVDAPTRLKRNSSREKS